MQFPRDPNKAAATQESDSRPFPSFHFGYKCGLRRPRKKELAGGPELQPRRLRLCGSLGRLPGVLGSFEAHISPELPIVRVYTRRRKHRKPRSQATPPA